METIKQSILTDLQNGKRLTVLSGMLNYKTVEMRKYISLLKKEGVNINSVWVTKNKKSFKEYFLQKEYNFKCFLLAIVLLTSCKKVELIDAIKDGAKLTKADAGYYVGTWWSEQSKDSLVVTFDCVVKDSIYYNSNMPQLDKGLTHSLNFKPKDDNLFLDGKVWRIEH